jgi:hypothetical protein
MGMVGVEKCDLCGAPLGDERPTAYNIIRQNGKRVQACPECAHIIRRVLVELAIPHVHAAPRVVGDEWEPGAISIRS